MEYTVNCKWDDEAKVWIATSENVHGLVLESSSLDALMEKVAVAVPELIDLNGLLDGSVKYLVQYTNA